MLDFYKGKKVFITGHTGFKGTWLTRILVNAGAEVTGYSLVPPTNPDLFSLADVENKINHVIGDIRDLEHLKKVFDEFQPEIVLHLAAQPIVRDSYKDPVYTYETNVMGTVNIMECIRLNPCSCSELVTHSYKNSFFDSRDIAVSTARAGNVIGGGDFANDRIIPDCVRAMKDGKVIGVRNPYSTRPYQHVLEPLAVYLDIAAKQYEDKKYQGYYNVGPDDCDCVTTGDLVDLFCKHWGEGAKSENQAEANAPHEANFLKLDCSKVKSTFGWQPRWHMEECMAKVCQFSKVWLAGGDIPAEMDKEINEFFGGK